MNAYELKQVSAMIKSLENTFMERLRQMERSYLDALKGFGIIDDEKMWTEKQVCEKYGIDRKTMYKYRKLELIPFTRKGERGKIYYLPADVRAFFADLQPA